MEQKTKGKGLIIVMSILLAVTTAFSVFVFLTNPFSGNGDGGGLFGRMTGSESLIPPGAEIKKDAMYLDIQGDWKGEFTFTKMEGMENMGAKPSEIQEVMAKPADFEFEFDEDGEWDLFIDAMYGMRMSSRDYRIDDPKTMAEQDFHIIKSVRDGKFKFSMDLSTDTDEMSGTATVSFDGIICEDSEGMLIVGKLSNKLTANGITVLLEGNYKIRPDELEYTDGVYE